MPLACKLVSVKEMNEAGLCLVGFSLSVAIWIAEAAGKCHALRPLGVVCEQGEILTLNLGARLLH